MAETNIQPIITYTDSDPPLYNEDSYSGVMWINSTTKKQWIGLGTMGWIFVDPTGDKLQNLIDQVQSQTLLIENLYARVVALEPP